MINTIFLKISTSYSFPVKKAWCTSNLSGHSRVVTVVSAVKGC